MNANVPSGAGIPAASDKYHVYRPLLDLIGHAEGTDRKRGYNETLAYGAFTGGDVDLVTMTLQEIEASSKPLQLISSRPLSDRAHYSARHPQDTETSAVGPV
jgi:hypothetical protein